MKVDVLNISGSKVDSIDLPDEVFASEVKEAVLWEQVKAQRASRRAGTHDTKTRDEVSGTNMKPFKQKGTGRARQGSNRAPHFVGGGTVFGPHPRDYSYRLPRSARRAALRSALSARAAGENALIVLDSLEFDVPKTKAIVELMGTLNASSALFVDGPNEALAKSSRNLPKAKYIQADAINVYDILDHGTLVLTKGAVEAVVAKAIKQSKVQPAAA